MAEGFVKTVKRDLFACTYRRTPQRRFGRLRDRLGYTVRSSLRSIIAPVCSGRFQTDAVPTVTRDAIADPSALR